MKKFKDFVENKEKSKIIPKEKTPFRDFIEDREDLSFKLDSSSPDFFLLEGGFIKYKSETGDYVELVEAEGNKIANVFLKVFNDRISWRYIDEHYWTDIDIEQENLIIEDGFIEYKTEKNWAKITVKPILITEEKGIPGKDGVDGLDGKDGLPGTVGPTGLSGKDGKDGSSGINGVYGKDGKDGKDGSPGKDGLQGKDGSPGKDGREVELKAEEQKFFWKYKDEKKWRFLVDFTKKSSELDRFKEIVDKAGADDPIQNYGQSVYPMLPGYSIGAPGPPGAAGAGVEMTAIDTSLYWRNIGNVDWIFLIDIATITPEVPPGEGITVAKNTIELGSGISKLDFLTDGEIIVNGSVATITLGEDMKYTVLLDFVDGGDYIYKGEAVPGSSGTGEGSAIWRISRTYIDPVTDDIDILWADGVITFDKIWTDHLTYTYS